MGDRRPRTAERLRRDPFDDDRVWSPLREAVSGRWLPERWQISFAWMQSARTIRVPHPDYAVAAILGDSAEVPKALLEEAQRVVLRVGQHPDDALRRAQGPGGSRTRREVGQCERAAKDWSFSGTSLVARKHQTCRT